MYEYSMEQLAQDIREVTAKAIQSKESALQFLKDAGIIDSINSFEEKDITAVTPEKIK